MRVAGNKLRHLRDFFFSELSGIFEEGEISALFKLAAEKYLGWNSVQQANNLEENLNQSDLLKLYDCAKDLREHKPLQYILNEAWFYDLPFYVTNAVLIPRPETEELVDLILKENKKISSAFDVGTGSGCIPVTLKKKRPEAVVIACDISPEALEVAKKNAAVHKTEIKFSALDILNNEQVSKTLDTPFEIIVSNPPYIKKSEAVDMHANVLKHEPEIALFAPETDEVIFYRHIIRLCEKYLQPGGRLYFELNPLTAEEVKAIAFTSGLFSAVELVSDLSGKKRLFKAVKLA